MAPTVYSEVTTPDRDVAMFVAAHLEDVNLYSLPVKYWVARQDGNIVALLMLKTDPYLSVDLIRADKSSRPFMRIVKLWRMAEAWLKAHEAPIVCASIHNSQAHFQALVRRLGFVKVGEESDLNGNVVETIFAKTLTGTAVLQSVSPTVH